MIFYYYSDSRAVAARRLRGLVKYLPNYGWKPTVLTVKSSECVASDKNIDNIRIVEIPYEDRITKFRRYLGITRDESLYEHFNISSHKNKDGILDILVNMWREIFTYPDAQKSWYRPTLNIGNKLFIENHFDAIISSSGPETSHIISRYFKEKYGTPWIADMRDLWTQNHYYQHSNIRRYIEQNLEIKTLSKADAIVTVSYPLAKKLREMHTNSNIYMIANGFDPDELSKFQQIPLSSKFNISYSGQLYKGKRDPEPLFSAIKRLVSKGYVDPRDIEVEFFGYKTGGWLEQCITKYRLENMVKVRGFIPRENVLKAQKSSQILLLLTWNDPRERGVYTGKVFEYLAAKRPILSLGCGGSVIEEILSETNSGIHVSTDEEVEMILKNLYKQYKKCGSVLYKGNDYNVEKYSHNNMTKEFVNILNQISS